MTKLLDVVTGLGLEYGAATRLLLERDADRGPLRGGGALNRPRSVGCC